MQIIGNDGRCEAVHAKIDNGEMIIEQGHDIILIPKGLADQFIAGVANVRAMSRPARRKQPKGCEGEVL
jgi:hypothetical protein